MKRILVSACLLGQKVRYNGSDKPTSHPAIERWRREGRLVPVCPELLAGFGTPRPPAEITGACDGKAVLASGAGARIVEDTGRDVTALFLKGASIAAGQARRMGCAYAILTDGSPSCGSTFIYDGSFSGTRTRGMGVAAALLEQDGVKVFPDTAIDALEAELARDSL